MLKDPYFYFAVLGVLLAIYSIYLALRKRNPGELSYLEEGAVTLLSDSVSSITDLTVLYQNTEIKKNIALLKFHIVNTGSKDLTKDAVGTPLTIALGESASWLQAKVTDFSPGVDVVCEINSNKLQFNLGMLRVSESFEIEALLELSNHKTPKEMRKNMRFTHRIADFAKVRTEELPTYKASKIKWLLTQEAVFNCIFFTLLFVVLTPLATKYFGKSQEIHYLFMHNGSKVETTVKPEKKSKLLKVTTISKERDWLEPAENFFGRSDLDAVVVESKSSSWVWGIYGFFIVAYSLLAVGDIKKFVRAKRLHKFLQSRETTTTDNS